MQAPYYSYSYSGGRIGRLRRPGIPGLPAVRERLAQRRGRRRRGLELQVTPGDDDLADDDSTPGVCHFVDQCMGRGMRDRAERVPARGLRRARRALNERRRDRTQNMRAAAMRRRKFNSDGERRYIYWLFDRAWWASSGARCFSLRRCSRESILQLLCAASRCQKQ